jgi:hypothetical protein
VNRRPDLVLLGHSASPEEAAAVIAAVEQFLRDSVPPTAPAPPRRSAWARQALLEGVGLGADAATPWGDPHPWA